MADNGLLVLQPIEVSRIVSGRSLEEELLWAMGRYELDSSDAAIVIETQRAGVRSLVTADRDLWRAHLDLDIYTWQNQAA
jgi:predicted nucleic acid-binding protein